MTKLITLTDADVRVLKGLVEQNRNRQRNTAGRTLETDQPSDLSQAYLAKAPSTGIAARVGLNVRKATCRVYQRVDLTLVDTGFDRVVYNASDTPITADALFSSWQDAWGTYWASDPASGDAGGEIGTGTPVSGVVIGNCDFATIRLWDNVIAISGTRQVLLTYSSGRWRSLNSVGSGTTDDNGYLQYPSGYGLVELWFANGFMHLSVAGLELLNCGDGCFRGGEMTGHVTPDTGIVDACAGVTFEVCVQCDPTSCTAFTGWAGPGWYCVNTGPGTGTHACIPLYLDYTDRCDLDILVCSGPYSTSAQAEILCLLGDIGSGTSCCGGLTPTNIVVNLPSIGTTVTLTFSGGTTGGWTSSTGTCTASGGTYNCATGALTITFGADNTGVGTMSVENCSPFNAVGTLNFTWSSELTCVEGAVAVTIGP